MTEDQKTPCWYAVDLAIAPQVEEIITWSLWESGAAGIQTLEETRTNIQISATFETIPDLEELRSELETALETASFEKTDLKQLTLREVPNEDWLKKWKEGYKPFPVGERFLITPSWIEPAAEVIGNRIVIQVDPGMAFGTGTHETTQLCLQALEKYWSAGKLLDVGTGTGILAIAAAKLHPEADIYAYDIDANAVGIARENASINGCENIRFEVGDVTTYAGKHFSIVVANLTIDILGPELPRLANVVELGGIVILSGLLITQLTDFRAIIEKTGLSEVSEETLGEWAMLAARRL